MVAGNIVIDPFQEEFMQPASVDLHLGEYFLRFKDTCNMIDVKEPLDEMMEEWHIAEGKVVKMKPGDFLLGMTAETVGVNGKIAARMDGKSSLGRIGLFIHITAGFIDPGNKLKLTLELFNASGRPIYLYPGMPIAQVSFHLMSNEVVNQYGNGKLNSKYYGAEKPQASQFYKNYKRV